MRVRSMVAAGALIVLLPLAGRPAQAVEIVVEDSRCHQLKDEDKAALLKKLRDAKAIGADDTIKCEGGPTTSITERNMSLGSILSAIGGAVCQVKSLLAKEKCADLTDDAQRAQCRSSEDQRYQTVRSACE